MQSDTKILVIGSLGQVGSELCLALKHKYGEESIIETDIRKPEHTSGIFEILDVMDKNALFNLIKKYQITEVYNLAALLSATAEKNPSLGWRLNMEGLFNTLDLAKEGHIKKLFWPSSIAVFGPTTPCVNTPQQTVAEPTTVYGISKLAGEGWCQYYHLKYGVDVRSLRYPGLIGWRSMPGGGTTDYAVEIFHEALKNASYSCFLRPEQKLPMMHTDDAIRATIEIMQAPANQIKIRNSYNLSAMSFSPQEIAAEIKMQLPNFKISYNPDHRAAIADSWPSSIDDSTARKDWNWQHKFDLQALVNDMISNLK
jgi:nucleoside-diphosphate-sugar epimerase